MALFDLVGTTLSGWLTDRWDSRYLLAWYYGLRGVSLLFLPMALGASDGARWAFAAFYGLDWIATVPPTVRLASEAFGAGNVGVMFAWIVAAHQLGAASASFLAGVLRTTTGDYALAFWVAGGLCFLAVVMVLRLRRTPALATA